MTTLSMEASSKVYDLIGFYDTEKSWCLPKEGDFSCVEPLDVRSYDAEYLKNFEEVLPAPTFAELIRAFVEIGAAKNLKHGSWRRYQATRFHAARMLRRYMEEPTEQDAMQSVEAYLIKLL